MKRIVITGVSSGLGSAMAQEALARGHVVVGTLREEAQRQEFEAIAPGFSVGRLLDVTETGSLATFVSDVETELGPIDVVINNAGYGLRGTIEELNLDSLRGQFDVNVFAPIALIQAVLPAMRERRAGHIVNIVSQGSIITFPGLGAYHGSKFALLGLSDTLTKEVTSLGIHVTAILPGLYGTEWNRRSNESPASTIDDYASVLKSDGEMNWGDSAALGRAVLGCDRNGSAARAPAGRPIGARECAPASGRMDRRDRPLGRSVLCRRRGLTPCQRRLCVGRPNSGPRSRVPAARHRGRPRRAASRQRPCRWTA